MTIRSRYYKNQRETIEAPEMQTVEPTISKINRHLNNGSPISFKFLLLTSLTALLFGCNENATNERSMDYQSDYRRIDSDQATDPLGAKIYELSNGLKVYLTENHEEPRFYAEIAVRAGSKHDPADATGLAHYLEHLLFKGTTELGTLNYEAEKPFLEKAKLEREQNANGLNKKDLGFKKFATVPDIVAIEIKNKWGIDLHDSATMHDKNKMAKFMAIFKQNYSHLMSY